MSDNRRDSIADAAIEIIATEGLRALTHRAIDSRLGYPAGSASYYLRTRQALIEAVVHRLSARTFNEVGSGAAAKPVANIGEAATLLCGLINGMATGRPLDHLARFALRIDLVNEPDLHGLIADQSPIRSHILAAGQAMLTTLGVSNAEQHAADLVALMDSLLFDRLTNANASADLHRVLCAYLSGLVLQRSAHAERQSSAIAPTRANPI